MIQNYYKHHIRPRLCFIPYIFAKIILFAFLPLYWLSGSHLRRRTDSHLCIEAGEKGWESIEFKELYQSACEYLFSNNVHRLIVKGDKNYLKQIADILKSEPITHYLYDPRTDNSDVLLWRPLWQSLRVAILLQKYGVVPIVLLTDLAVRSWRTQAALVSARRGVVVCFMSSRRISSIFPHRRLIGPSLMPISVQTMQMLNRLIAGRKKSKPATALFAGSLYEPRTKILEQIRSGLASSGFVFEIKGRQMGSARVSDEEYWSSLCFSDIIVTTADQAIQDTNDWNHIHHLVYRYLEVLASGAMLVAQDVPGVNRYFTPGVHFVSYDTPENAVKVIAHYLHYDVERLRIAKQGKDRANDLIASRVFWVIIDSVLSGDSLL